MKSKNRHSLKSFGKGRDKDIDKLEQLKAYVNKSKYIDLLEQPKVCASFGLPYTVKVFRDIYRERVYNYLKDHTTTAATVSKITSIPHKYVTQVKKFYEKRTMLKVVALSRCPTTNTNNVQFISTNKEEWDYIELPESNQLKFFSHE